jgi:O-antigen/teichoic acid export membrane protein
MGEGKVEDQKAAGDMIPVILKDGSVYEVSDGTTWIDVAAGLSRKLAKEALAAWVDGNLKDLNLPARPREKVEFLTFADQEGQAVYRHTSAHLLAQAVKRIFPGAKLAIGPAIADGFYYDFDVEHPFTTEDLALIEKEMNKIKKADFPIVRQELSHKEAIALFEEQSEPYKVELIRELPADSQVSVGFFFWMAAARIYSVGDVGLTTALIASQSLITLFSLFGFDFSLIRFLPTSNKRKVYNTCLVITSVFSIIISVLYISCIEIISPELVFLQKHKLAAFFLLFSLLNTITLINGNALLALRKGGEFLVQNILLALRIPLLFILASLKSYGIFASMGLAYLFSTTFGIFMLNKLIGVHIQADKHFIRKSFKFSIWNYLSNILANVPSLIMPVMILNLLGNAEAAKYYIAAAIANFVLIIPDAIGISLFVEGSHGENLKKMLIKSASAIALCMVPLVIMIYFMGNTLLGFFGKDYIEAYGLLKLLVLSSFFVTIYMLFLPIQNIKMKPQRITLLNSLRASLLLSLSYTFIKKLGITGYGYAWMITYGILGLGVAGIAIALYLTHRIKAESKG